MDDSFERKLPGSRYDCFTNRDRPTLPDDAVSLPLEIVSRRSRNSSSYSPSMGEKSVRGIYDTIDRL